MGITDLIMRLITTSDEAKQNMKEERVSLYDIKAGLERKPLSALTREAFDADYEAALVAAEALSYIPIKVLEKEFEIGILIAIFKNQRYIEKTEKFGKNLARHMGMDYDLLELSRRGQHHRAQEKTITGILKTYDLIYGIAQGTLLNQFDMQTHLQEMRTIDDTVKI